MITMNVLNMLMVVVECPMARQLVMNTIEQLILFQDIKYSQYDHEYWDNYELRK